MGINAWKISFHGIFEFMSNEKFRNSCLKPLCFGFFFFSELRLCGQKKKETMIHIIKQMLIITSFSFINLYYESLLRYINQTCFSQMNMNLNSLHRICLNSLWPLITKVNKDKGQSHRSINFNRKTTNYHI